MSGASIYKIHQRLSIADSILLVCWHEDSGCVGNEVSRFFIDSLNMPLFAEIDPEDFFPMSGVVVENDIAKFPESKLYVSVENNLVILDSAVPRSEWFKFINAVLEIAEKVCNVAEIFTVGSMISFTSHTTPRTLMASMNNPESRRYLKNYDISLNMDYETPAGQRPTMSTYLVWEALCHNIKGISLWVPVPFYMVGVRDWAACQKIIDFFISRLSLEIDTTKLNQAVARQDNKIASIIDDNCEIKEIMNKFVSNRGITESESSKLADVIEEQLGHGDHF